MRFDVFDSSPDGDGEIISLSRGRGGSQPDPDAVPLVRLHSTCVTGEVLGSLTCDCGPQLDNGLARVMAAQSGIFLYITNHEGRGIGLSNKIRAIKLQLENGLNTVDANLALGLPVDARDFSHCVEVLRQLGVRAMRLLTNNPEKVRIFQSSGIKVVERIPLDGFGNPHNARYLETKRDLLGHLLATEDRA